MIPQKDRWLHAAFAASSLAIVALVGVAVAREYDRPLNTDQRLVPALGVVDRCVTCHDEAQHPGTLLDRHPVDRFGCTPCHGGQGLATDKRAAHAVSPDWERPLLTKAERSAACGACHLGRDAPEARLATGRNALAARGCTGCHVIPGVAPPDHAPELDGLRDKVRPDWVRAWLADPAKVDPRHKMPTFRLAPEEIEALVAYLWTLPGVQLAAAPTEVQGDSDRGRTTLATLRCATCHRFEGRGGEFGPDLGLAGMKLDPVWLFNYLIDTHRLRPHTRMPGFRLAAQDAADIVAYAAEQWVPDSGVPPWQANAVPAAASLAGKGQKLFVDLGCGGCHLVAGKRAPAVAPALDRLGDRRAADQPVRADGVRLVDMPNWVAQKVLTPQAFDVKGAQPARMPTFPGVTLHEAQDLGIALAASHATAPPEPWVRRHDPAPPHVPPGETGQLISRFRCLSCHQLGGQGGDVARVPLDQAGARLRRPWLDRFLQNPVTVRMDQAERMPLLGLSAAQAQRLANWIESSLGDDAVGAATTPVASDVERGKVLYAQHDCAACHVGAGTGTMKGPTLDGARDRLRPDYVEALLRAKPDVVPGHRHPASAHLAADQARAVAAFVLSLPAPWPWAPADDAPPAQ